MRRVGRACRLRFGERPGAEVEYELLCEVMGRYSNAFLLDVARGETVLACGYQVGERQTSARRLGVGCVRTAADSAGSGSDDGGGRGGVRGVDSRGVCARERERVERDAPGWVFSARVQRRVAGVGQGS